MSDIKDDKQSIQIRPIEYAIFCDYASVSMGGKLNLNGMFDRVLAKDLPAMQPQMFVVTKMVLPQGDHKVTLTLMQQDKVIAKSTTEKKIEEKLKAHTHFWSLQGIKFESWDPIELQILIGGKQVYVKRLPLVKVQEKKKD
jgi:hypothetical protein